MKLSWSFLSLKLNWAGSGYSVMVLSLPLAEELASMPAVAPVTLSLLALSCRASIQRMRHTYPVIPVHTKACLIHCGRQLGFGRYQ